MEDSNGERSKTQKKGRLFRPVSINLAGLILLLILLTVVPATVYLSLRQIQTHERWFWEGRASQDFDWDLIDACAQLNNTYFSQPSTNTSTENTILQYWFYLDINNAGVAIGDLAILDSEHTTELIVFSTMLITINSKGQGYLEWINTTERSNIATKIETVGKELVSAYWNPLNGTSVARGSGPPFWYLGPAPPDETILKQAVELATNITEQISQAING